MNDLTEYIKKAFEYKADGSYKQAIDYFYKALALDNDSCEIMTELAYLYSKLQEHDRAVSFYEQVLAKHPDDYSNRYFLALLYKKIHKFEKAKEQLIILFNAGAELIQTAEELFDILAGNEEYDKIIELYNSKANSLNSSVVYYYVAISYLNTKRKNIADEFFNKSFEKDETNVDSGSYVAERLFENGKYEEAENLLNKLLKYSENDKIFYLLAEINYLNSDLDSAIKYYSMAVRLNDKNGQYFYKLASTYAQKGFLIEAEENYSRAITIDYDNILYNYTLAYLYYMERKYDLAKRIVDYIFTIQQDYLPALAIKLLILLNEDNIVEAGKIAEKINQKNRKSEFSYYALAMYYSKLNNWNKSISNIKGAITYNEDSCEYNSELAKFYYELRDYEKSKKICDAIISINPKYINAYIVLASLSMVELNYEQALTHINEALKLDMNIPEIYYMKGFILDKRNDNEKAIENYKIAISMSPEKIEYYEALAGCYYKNKNFEEAFFYYKEASMFDVSNAKYRFYMAKCAEEMEDFETAASNYSLAKRLAPTNAQYLEDYANFLCKINKKKSAISILNSSVKQLHDDEKEKIKQLIKKMKNGC